MLGVIEVLGLRVVYMKEIELKSTEDEEHRRCSYTRQRIGYESSQEGELIPNIPYQLEVNTK